METIRVNTDRREQLVDITAEVRGSVESSGVTSGVCVLWSMHTTAGLTVNESADPDVATDIEDWLAEAAPEGGGYRHREGNADSHIKTSLTGPGLTLIVEDGRLQLGTWQGVFLCEFDGPRTRDVGIQVLESA
ncbi:MAG: secondary thiamine-phosphate synthase enzyme YjbQ [Candidatus Palauibacterales bacterium]|nr:secondary thiamine-phosphate synthase enzyme YjbQ [Candidatus Palauibacterales bacterium]